MFKYRPGEGVYARGTTFWALAGFAYLAGRRFFLYAQRWDFSRRNLLGGEIPVLAAPLTPGFLYGIAVFIACVVVIVKLLNAPKIADVLIDTELEMKKVTWPSFDESRKSSLVVIACVAIMVLFLTASDYGLQWLFFSLVYGGGHGR